MGVLGWEKQEGAGEGDYGHGEEEGGDREECDVGLGLRMQPNHNNNTSSSSSSCVLPNRMSMEVPLQYFAGDYLSGWSSSVFAYGGNTTITQFAYPGLGCTPTPSLLHSPSDCYYPAKSLQHHPLGFSGKMAASSSGDVRVPFTAAQWKEVERQNWILKHMMASSASVSAAAAFPVPPEHLPTPIPMPTTKSFSDVASAAPYHPTRSGDPEPWRCRRTDGKKWRCSRDVAPLQKYCERHSHKNRPRSRKPVELTPAMSTTTTDYLLDATKTTAVAASTAARRSVTLPPPQPPVDPRQAFSSHFCNPYDHNHPSGFPSAFASSQPFDHPRCLDWLMKGESIPSSNPNQDWQPQNDVSMASKSDAAAISRKYNSGGESFIDPFQQKQSSPYSTPQRSSLFLMDGVVDPIHSQHTRRFIDAWSNVNDGSGNKEFIDAWSNVNDGSGNKETSSYGPYLGKNDLATSSLTLTMCRGGDEYINRMGEKPQWMNAGMVHHGSWMGSQPGGPLAEALCLGSIAGRGGGGMRYQTSSRGCSSITAAAVSTTSSQSSSKDEGHEEFNFIG